MLKIFDLTENIKFCYKDFTRDILIINDFDNFVNLVNISNCYLNEKGMRIIPKDFLILNNDLEIGLRDKKLSRFSLLEFYHLKGIDITVNIFQTLPNMISFPFTYIKYSYFNFYFKDDIIGEDHCNMGRNNYLFNSLFPSVPYMFFLDCIYSQKTCALVFKDSSIKHLIFSYMLKSSFSKNYLKFIKSNISMRYDNSLNANIEMVTFNDFYRISLNLNILNNQVFKLIKYIFFSGSISNIEINMFDNFEFIEGIRFELYNLDEFVQEGLDWLDHLYNTENKVKVALVNYEKPFYTLYEYQNEDWCLFKKALNNVRIQLYSNHEMYDNKSKNFSCILAGFLKNQNTYELQSSEWYKKWYINDTLGFYKFLKNCQMIDCSFKEYTVNKHLTTFDYYNFIATIFYFELILEFILQPFISTFGILANLFVIFILKNKKNQKDFNDKMYFYIYYNSVFNCIILLLDLIRYINKCSFISNDFCPIFRETLFAQYIFILTNYMENYLAFCSNLTMLYFSIERFKNLLGDDSKKSSKFLKFMNKYFFYVSSFMGLILNAISLFEYKINKDYLIFNFPTQLDVSDFNDQLHCLLFFICWILI